MKIEKVEVLVHLKAGSKVFPKGRVYENPEIPDELIQEVRAGAGTVRVLTSSMTTNTATADPPPAPAQVQPEPPTAEKSDKDAAGMDEPEKQILCETCGAGPFKDGRGLHLHILKNPSCKKAVTDDIGRVEDPSGN